MSLMPINFCVYSCGRFCPFYDFIATMAFLIILVDFFFPAVLKQFKANLGSSAARWGKGALWLFWLLPSVTFPFCSVMAHIGVI